jgi:phosphoglycolate phosphatase
LKAVVIDIDGTLTDMQRRLDLRAAAAIRELTVPVILASGNVLGFVKCAAKLIGTSDIMIAENGGVVSMGFDGPVHVGGNKARCQEVLGILGEHFDLEELDGTERRSEVALRRNFDIGAARQVLVDGNIRDIELVDTGFAVHIKTVDVNKGTALVMIAEMMGLNTGDFVAIGDSANDIEMIRAAGLGVAVGNAHPALKDVADLVTTGQYGAGVVEALEKIEKMEKR